MALNEELNWAQVGDISTASGRVRDAFQLMFGDPTKELLPAGTSLYKFNGFSTLGQGAITAQTDLSPWRSPTQGFNTTQAWRKGCQSQRRTAFPSANGATYLCD